VETKGIWRLQRCRRIAAWIAPAGHAPPWLSIGRNFSTGCEHLGQCIHFARLFKRRCG
jgi:hypothetical protein